MNYSKRLNTISLILLLICLIPGKSMSAKINRDCDFSHLDLSVPTGKNACSPIVTKKQIMQGLTGVFINMPTKIRL